MNYYEIMDINTDLTEIKRINRQYHEQVHANKLDNQDKMKNFLEIHKLLEIRRNK